MGEEGVWNRLLILRGCLCEESSMLSLSGWKGGFWVGRWFVGIMRDWLGFWIDEWRLRFKLY